MIKNGIHGKNELEIDTALAVRQRALDAYPEFLKTLDLSDSKEDKGTRWDRTVWDSAKESFWNDPCYNEAGWWIANAPLSDEAHSDDRYIPADYNAWWIERLLYRMTEKDRPITFANFFWGAINCFRQIERTESCQLKDGQWDEVYLEKREKECCAQKRILESFGIDFFTNMIEDDDGLIRYTKVDVSSESFMISFQRSDDFKTWKVYIVDGHRPLSDRWFYYSTIEAEEIEKR